MVVTTVDEETGGGEGAVWLCENHPDTVRCDYVLNEGAGTVIPFDGTPVYGVCVAEKGVFRFTLTTRGRGRPRVDAGRRRQRAAEDGAAARGAGRAAAPALDVTDAPRALLAALDLDGDGDAERGASSACASATRAWPCFVEPMLGVTLAPTVISASEKINVLPAARAPAGRLPRAARPRRGDRDPARPRGARATTATRSSSHEQVVGNGSPVESPLMDAIRGWVGREDPGARGRARRCCPAFTDSRTFRGRVPGRASPTASSRSGR